MKICVIGYSAKKIAPYLQFYIDYFSNKNVEFDFITREIDKNHLDIDVLSNQYVIECVHSNNIIGKIRNVIVWKRKVTSILKEKNYDKLVLLTGYPSILLSKYVIKKYKYRYVVDLRDYLSLFKYKTINSILYKTLYNSAFVVVSSDGFRKWLPVIDKIYTVHNCPQKEITNNRFTVSTTKVVKIGYFGVISYININKKLIDYLCDEEDFSLLYAGVYDSSNSLQEYVKDRKVGNVLFGGAFNNDEKESLYNRVDMINAVYGDDSMIVTSALPNKLYDAALYKKPIIVSKNTYLAEVVEEYNLGISIDINSNPAADIRKYIRDFDEDLFLIGAKRLLNKCNNDNSRLYTVLDEFVGE